MKCMLLKQLSFLFFLSFFLGCKQQKEASSEILSEVTDSISESRITHARGFSIEESASGLTIIKVHSPWPNAQNSFSYALVPKEKMAFMTLNKDAYDAIIAVPVEHIVVTSTTHIPALEALGVTEKLVGFPDSQYVSSKATRERIEKGLIKDLGSNEAINTEIVIELQPEVVIGFGIDGQNKAYRTLQRSNIPVVYNGDWTEETPLGKAEWIKFVAPFFGLEKKADSLFSSIETSYVKARQLAKAADHQPSVLSGALYKDVWYLPGGNSWAAQFIKDANARYLWEETQEAGSLSLSIESVLNTAKNADFWVAPSQYESYQGMKDDNTHYRQFNAFQNKNVYTFAHTKGATGGLLYYELGPSRPDLILKDLIHIFHPELLPEYEPFFFKPLE